MAADRYHKAAKDGQLDVLKEATRKDANHKDDDSMTPVMWAAFEGHLDALRLLCGRGGDPDKCDQFGNTALHLAAAKGHLHCVEFLIKFGVNMYALDVDKHSAKDLAAINNRDDILRYLDAAAVSFMANDRKKAKALKEQAEKNCEKRMREYLKRQQRQFESNGGDYTADLRPTGKSLNVLSTLKHKIWSSPGAGNPGKGNKENNVAVCGGVGGGPAKFSELVGGGGGGGCGGSLASRAGSCAPKNGEPHCQSGENELEGKRIMSAALIGLQRDADLLYVNAYATSDEENGRRGRISNIFEVEDEMNKLSETACCELDGIDCLGGEQNTTHAVGRCQPPHTFSHTAECLRGGAGGAVGGPLINHAPLEEEHPFLQRPAGIFDRPMIGSLAFRRSVTAVLSAAAGEGAGAVSPYASASIAGASAGREGKRGKMRSQLATFSDTDDDCEDDDGDDDDSDGADAYSEDDQDLAGSPMQRFLTVWALEEYLSVFDKQQIDLDTLMLLTESDLKSLALPLGPFRKLTFAIQERRNALANPGAMCDSHL